MPAPDSFDFQRGGLRQPSHSNFFQRFERDDVEQVVLPNFTTAYERTFQKRMNDALDDGDIGRAAQSLSNWIDAEIVKTYASIPLRTDHSFLYTVEMFAIEPPPRPQPERMMILGYPCFVTPPSVRPFEAGLLGVSCT